MEAEIDKIVRKIANFDRIHSEGLTEEEFRVLDTINGRELADIAYNNQINFQRFLKNADEMIDLYNEQLIVGQIKEVKALKKQLQNTAPFTRPNIEHRVPVAQRAETERQQDEVEAEQRVQEVPQPAVVPEIEIELASGDESLAQQVPNVKRTFVSHLQADMPSASTRHSLPDLHRDAVRQTGHITMNQNEQLAPSNLIEQSNVEVPLWNESQMAQLGLFDGTHGKKMSRILHEREQIDIQISLDIPQIPPPQMVSSVVDEPPPIIEAPLNVEETPLHSDEPIEQQMEMLHIENPIPIPVEQPSLEQPNLDEIVAAPAEEERNRMTERYDSFRKAVEAADLMLANVKRRVRRPQRQQRAEEPARGNNDELTLLKLRKEVPPKAKRRQRPRPVKFPKRVNNDLSFFDDIDEYEQNDLPFEEEMQEVQVPQIRNRPSEFVEFNPVTNRGATSTPMHPTLRKRTNQSPENSQISKRMKTLEISTPEPIAENEPIVAEVEVHNQPQPVEPEPMQSAITIPNAPLLDSNIMLAPIMEIPEPAPQEALPSLFDIPAVPVESGQQSIEIPQLPTFDTPIHTVNDIQVDLAEPPIPPAIQQHSQIAEASRDQIDPQARKQSRQISIQNLELSKDSIDYDRLLRNSKHRKTPLNSRAQITPDQIFQNACENISEQEAIKVRNNRVVDSGPKRMPPTNERVSREREATQQQSLETTASKFEDFTKVRKNGASHVVLNSNDGTKSTTMSEHNLQLTALYCKIRMLMKELKGNNPWKMTIKEVFGNLKDLKDPKFVTYQRLLHMTQQKLFIGTFSDNDMLTEIEIPLDRFDSADKEN